MHCAAVVQARELKAAVKRQATRCVIIFIALNGAGGNPFALRRWAAARR